MLAVAASSEARVMHVHASPESPVNIFATRVQSGLESHNWKVVTLDPLVFANQSGLEVLKLISDAVGFVHTSSPVSSGTVAVGTGASAGRDLIIEKIKISAPAMSESTLAKGLSDHIKSLSDIKLAILMVNSHNFKKRLLNRFHAYVWNHLLATLPASRVTLVDIFHLPGMSNKGSSWPPSCDQSAEIHSQFLGQAVDDAHQDLQRIALTHEWQAGEDNARRWAQTILESSHDIADLHARLSLIRQRREAAHES